jgi:hypothetical protein
MDSAQDMIIMDWIRERKRLAKSKTLQEEDGMSRKGNESKKG